MDKIGDLVLALPADQQADLPLGARVTWIVSKGCGFVAKYAVPPREYVEIPKEWSLRNFRQLVRVVKSLKPDLAIVLHAPWWVGLALWRAKVPRRYVRRSQWHSWLFFNQGIRQSRKHSERHETDLNTYLVNSAVGKPNASIPSPLQLKAPTLAVEQWGLQPKSYIVVHPGMAGSALNISSQRWIEIITSLIANHNVAVTGTKMDRAYVEPLFKALGHESRITWLNEKLGIEDLLSVLAQAQAVIAPSTGVLHLGASLGAPVVGIYSPVPVQRPARWGARGPLVKMLEPPASRDELMQNPLATMERIQVSDVMKALKDLGVQS